MQETKLFYTAAEVATMLGISVGQAYKILRQWNEELKKKHYLVIACKIPFKFFLEKVYGNGNSEDVANG